MLIDWPEQKAEWRDFLQRALHRATVEGAPLTSSIPRFIACEGDALEYAYPDGTSTRSTFQRMEASAEFEKDQVLKGGGDQIIEAVSRLGGSMAERLERSMIEVMRQAPPSTMLKFSASDLDRFGEEFLQGLEGMDVSFDDDGKPSLSFVVHPDTVEQLKATETPELQARMNDILERKRREWLRRESSRRLAD